MMLKQQAEAFDKLKAWKVGALFMKPGTGKTRAAMEIIKSINCSDVFWFGPLRTLDNTTSSSVPVEIERWGGLHLPVTYIGVESISMSDRIYLSVVAAITKSKNPFLVVDESLKIKNAESKRTKRLLELSKLAQYKLVLNGTPITKNLMDLWSQMEFLSPKILNCTHEQFKRKFCIITKITKRDNRHSYSREFITGYENVDYLYSLIRHYIYECDLNLNISQIYKNKEYIIDNECKEEYYRIKKLYLEDEMLMQKNNNIFLELTQKMQHSYACTPSKFECINNIFNSVPQNKSIIFCKYKSSVAACKKKYPNALILSYQKESLGLNLQDRYCIIYFDKTWDLAARYQSLHRTFRTGQEEDCIYYDLTGDVGLERLIDVNIEKKTSLLDYFRSKTINDLKKDL